MAGERDLVRVHHRQRVEIIDATARGPRPPRQLRPIARRPDGTPRVGVIPRIRTGIHNPDVATTHRDQRPTSMRVLRHEHGERPGAVGNDHFQMQTRRTVRTEFQRHLLHRGARLLALLEVRHARIARARRPCAGDVILNQCQQLRATLQPFLNFDLAAIREAKRVGQVRGRGKRVKVRRHRARRHEPFLPRLAFRQDTKHLLQLRLLLIRRERPVRRRATGGEHHAQQRQDSQQQWLHASAG